MVDNNLSKEVKAMKSSDWVLIWAWVAFVAIVGPFLISARDTWLVIAGIALLVALAYFTQRRVVPIIMGKLK